MQAAACFTFLDGLGEERVRVEQSCGCYRCEFGYRVAGGVEFFPHGARVVMACRNMEKAKKPGPKYSPECRMPTR